MRWGNAILKDVAQADPVSETVRLLIPRQRRRWDRVQISELQETLRTIRKPIKQSKSYSGRWILQRSRIREVIVPALGLWAMEVKGYMNL